MFQDKLRSYILACQDEETGGFADRPGDMVRVIISSTFVTDLGKKIKLQTGFRFDDKIDFEDRICLKVFTYCILKK